jgi:hypothetical protein
MDDAGQRRGGLPDPGVCGGVGVGPPVGAGRQPRAAPAAAPGGGDKNWGILPPRGAAWPPRRRAPWRPVRRKRVGAAWAPVGGAGRDAAWESGALSSARIPRLRAGVWAAPGASRSRSPHPHLNPDTRLPLPRGLMGCAKYRGAPRCTPSSALLAVACAESPRTRSVAFDAPARGKMKDYRIRKLRRHRAQGVRPVRLRERRSFVARGVCGRAQPRADQSATRRVERLVAAWCRHRIHAWQAQRAKHAQRQRAAAAVDQVKPPHTSVTAISTSDSRGHRQLQRRHAQRARLKTNPKAYELER